MTTLIALVLILLSSAAVVSATPILTTLEGCVTLNDPRLVGARWSSPGTFQAVAFDSPLPGCEPTIESPVREAYFFDEDRVNNTLAAWLNMGNLPTCGRRQYDLHLYFEEGILDPMGLKSLVIDTGIPCETVGVKPGTPTGPSAVPESGALLLLATGAATWGARYRCRRRINLLNNRPR